MNHDYTLEIWEDGHVLYFRCTAEGVDYWIGGAEPSDNAIFRGHTDVEPFFETSGQSTWGNAYFGPGCG